MARFIFTMASSEDLGLPGRLLPIARALSGRGHDVALINSAKGPAAMIADAGLQRITLPAISATKPPFDMQAGARAFDVEHLLGLLYSDAPYLKALTSAYREAFQSFRPDVVIDSFAPYSCLAASIEGLPLVQVTQGNFLADSPGFIWWKGRRPSELPSSLAAINIVAAEQGLPLVRRAADILDGNCTFVVGSPETDPLNPGANAIHVGSLGPGNIDADLPEAINVLGRGRKLVWVYTGNPRYGGAAVATPFDSKIVLHTALEALGGTDIDVVLTTGYQAVPEGVAFPQNIHFANFVSGPAMAQRCDLIIHHGGHGSVITGLSAGKPAVIIPTNSERESNARRLASIGAGEVVLPIDETATEKSVDTAAFADAVRRVLTDPSYTDAAQQIGSRMLRLGGAGDIIEKAEALAAAG